MDQMDMERAHSKEEAPRPGEILYQTSCERFGALLAEDVDSAAKEYGLTLLNSVDPSETMYYLQTMGFEPKNWENRFQLAVYAQKQGRLDEARSLYEDLLSERKDRKEIHHNLAVLEQAAGSADRARLHLETFESWINSLPELQIVVEWREMAQGLREKL